MLKRILLKSALSNASLSQQLATAIIENSIVLDETIEEAFQEGYSTHILKYKPRCIPSLLGISDESRSVVYA